LNKDVRDFIFGGLDSDDKKQELKVNIEIKTFDNGDGWYNGCIYINNIEVWRTSRQYQIETKALESAEQKLLDYFSLALK
jgi:hypothetical protein